MRKSATLNVNNVQDIKCRNDIVIVSPIKEEEIGGLIIPQNAQEQGQKGTVMNVGPGTEDVRMQVKLEDRILYVRYAGSEVSIEGEKYIIMRQEDILGVYTGETPIDIKPLDNRILIEWEFGRDEYIGTTILRSEGASKERYYTGVVMAIGPDAKEIEVGQRIFFNQFCGPERIDYNGKRYAMIYDDHAYCVLPLRKDITVLSH